MALTSVEGVESVVVDTTARAILTTKKNAKPSQDDLDSALARSRSSVKSMKKLEVTKPMGTYEIRIKGMS